MALRLFHKFKNGHQSPAHRIPEGVCVYAVGDIHGRADLIAELHERIQEDSKKSGRRKNVVVYLGDYVDRGPGVREAVDEVISGLPGAFEKVYLMGNHEQILLEFLEDSSVYGFWAGLGGSATLLSYGVSAFNNERRAEEARRELAGAMPEKHLEFLKNLRLSYRIGDYLFVHAGIRPGMDVEKQAVCDLLWVRDDFLLSEKDHGFRVVHGHTVAGGVQECFNRLGVDTGAYATGVLTCGVLENSGVRYIDAGNNRCN